MDETAANTNDFEMTPEQFDLTNNLFAAVYNVADGFGAEASEVAQIILTARKSLATCKFYFPKNFKFELLTEDAFRAAARDAETVNSLLEVIPEAEKTFGIFREDNASWWLCVFWNSAAKIGSNAFFRAHRVET